MRIEALAIVYASVGMFALSPVHATTTCLDRFVAAVSEGNGNTPTRIRVEQTIKGQKPTVNDFIMNSRDHWVTIPVVPKGGAQTLLHDGTMYTSKDGGKNWSVITKFDKVAAEKARNDQLKDAQAATDLACDVDEVEGKSLDRVSGTYQTTKGFKTQQNHTYWIDPKTSLIVRSYYETKAKGFESTVSQVILPLGDAVVPTP